MNQERAEKLIPLLKLKPGIIHNNRLGGGFKGDTETPEQHIPATGFPGRDWETCMTMNGTWGYKSYDDNWKSTETLLRNLIDIVSKGGNYLFNVGPTAEGLIPQPSIERLAEVGKWMKVNGEAIYGTTASPFKKLPFNGRCTRKPGKLYLHVFDWPADGKLLVPMTNPITKAYLLTAPANVLPVTSTDNGQSVALPAEAPDKIATVIVAEIAGEPEVIVPPVQPVAQAADGVLKLDATEAILHGDTQARNQVREPEHRLLAQRRRLGRVADRHQPARQVHRHRRNRRPSQRHASRSSSATRSSQRRPPRPATTASSRRHNSARSRSLPARRRSSSKPSRKVGVRSTSPH